ncbi:MAG: Metal-dependent phosphohydrolase, subdomain [Proteobacteria bacterium]|nr:Metal-dependent phosphohydrolase, subdomain [Pseudomonadota bacterium]
MEIVSVADLKIGMFVAEPDCPWSEFSFAFQGFVITSPEQVDVFQQKCRFVSIDRSRSLNEHYAAPKQGWDRSLRASPFQVAGADGDGRLGGVSSFIVSAQDKQQARRRRFLDFLHSQKDDEQILALSRELSYIEPRYDELSDALEQAFDAFAEGREVDILAVREGLRDIAGSLQRNSDAVMWLLRLRQRDQYSFDHAMDVSVNMIMLGTHIGWREHQLLELGLAGMMQDVGKTQLPVALLTKKTDLTAEERKLVQSHVASSLEILYSQANLPPEVILTVARHHERWDGSGYPRGLKFEQIGMAAEIAGMADSFCAMLKDKPYRSALGHQEALEELHNLRGKQFNPALMEQFVQCVGLYPIGTLVELNTGEVAVVIQQNRVKRSKPRLVLMLDAQKERVRTYRIIDLRDAANANLRIAKALAHNAYGLAPNDYYLG